MLAPFLGTTVLERALSGLASEGAKRVLLRASDRPGEIRLEVGRGEAWGMEVLCGEEPAPAWDPERVREFILDRLPQLPQQPLWGAYRDWYSAQCALLAVTAGQRVGMRELSPGAFVGMRSQVASDARVAGPCWIGANVFLGPGAVVGPGSVIGDGSYIDEGAEISGSVVGPDTYVGRFTEVRDSFAWGNELLHLDTGSSTQVADRFLLADLRPDTGVVGGLAGAVRAFRDRITGKSRRAARRPENLFEK